jgi:hypothetical protein
VSEKRVPRKIFGPKRDEVTGEWLRRQSKELCDLYYLPNYIWAIKSRRTRWVGHVARMGERTGACRILWGNLREIQLRRRRRVCEVHSKTNLQKIVKLPT